MPSCICFCWWYSQVMGYTNFWTITQEHIDISWREHWRTTRFDEEWTKIGDSMAHVSCLCNVDSSLPAPTSLDFCHTDLNKMIVSYTNAEIRVFDVETGQVTETLQGSNENYGRRILIVEFIVIASWFPCDRWHIGHSNQQSCYTSYHAIGCVRPWRSPNQVLRPEEW